MSSGALGVLSSLEALYRRAVSDPHSIDPAVIEDWLAMSAEPFGFPMPKPLGRALRRAARTTVRLAEHWEKNDPSTLPDWRNGVDDALGARGWEPALEIALAALELDPDPELFAEAGRLYRAVHFQPWLPGVTYEEWLAERDDGQPA